jgi:hypothetical protein
MLASALAGHIPAQSADAAATSDAKPFVGERTIYRVEWNPPWYLFFLPTMEAGEAELSVSEVTEFEGKKALRIVFQARSSGTLVKLAGVKIDDHFEFLSDPETFCTFVATKNIREGKRKRDITVRYLPETNRLHFREVDLTVTPPAVKKDEFKNDIPGCVKDLFSALYFVRRLDLKPGMRHKSLVGDNDKIKEVEAHVEKKEIVTTPKGKYPAWKLNTIALVGGLFKEGGQFRIWVSADEKKLPVQFEAKVNLGTVIGKLKAAEF